MDDAFHAEVVVTRKPQPERKVLFTCLICEETILEPLSWRAGGYGHGAVREREPVCKRCAKHCGSKAGGPVFNRQNYHSLQQLSAMITRVKWEIRNGHRRYRY